MGGSLGAGDRRPRREWLEKSVIRGSRLPGSSAGSSGSRPSGAGGPGHSRPPRWCTPTAGRLGSAVGRRHLLLSTWVSPQGCLRVLRVWQLAPRGERSETGRGSQIS